MVKKKKNNSLCVCRFFSWHSNDPSIKHLVSTILFFFWLAVITAERFAVGLCEVFVVPSLQSYHSFAFILNITWPSSKT